LEFELDEDDFLWIYTLAGERLLTYEEVSERAAEEAARRQELERQLAELQARLQLGD
jgi:hypothetical protein